MHNLYNNIRTILWLILFLLLLIILEKIPYAYSYSNHILINEVLYNPEGTDTGNEWIELYNPTDTDIDLIDWKIEKAGIDFEEVLIIEQSIIVPSEEFILICGEHVEDCDLNIPKLGFQNGGGTTDGIRLLDNNDIVIDAIFYDLPNTNQLYDENGILVTDEITADNTDSGESLGRETYIDTGNYNSDFKIFTSPTPKRINYIKEDIEEEIVEPEIVNEDTTVEPRTELIQTGYNILPIYSIFLILLIFIIHKYSAMLHKN